MEGEVRRTAARKGAEWVNDVVLIYYQGRDFVGGDGRRRLHTDASLGYTGARADQLAVLVEELPPTPGVRLVLLNVVDPGAPQPAVDALAVEPPMLRYRWRDPAAMTQLFALYEQAVKEQSKLGGVIDRVRDGIGKLPAPAEPSERVPLPVRERRIGLGPP